MLRFSAPWFPVAVPARTAPLVRVQHAEVDVACLGTSLHHGPALRTVLMEWGVGAGPSDAQLLELHQAGLGEGGDGPSKRSVAVMSCRASLPPFHFWGAVLLLLTVLIVLSFQVHLQEAVEGITSPGLEGWSGRVLTAMGRWCAPTRHRPSGLARVRLRMRS